MFIALVTTNEEILGFVNCVTMNEELLGLVNCVKMNEELLGLVNCITMNEELLGYTNFITMNEELLRSLVFGHFQFIVMFTVKIHPLRMASDILDRFSCRTLLTL